MSDAYVLAQACEECRKLAFQHAATWRNKSEMYWLAGLVEEVGELASALNDRHEHGPDLELREIASIAQNWLAMRKEATNDPR